MIAFRHSIPPGPPQWILTGKPRPIRALRELLRDRRVLFSKFKTKAYRAEGKTDLD